MKPISVTKMAWSFWTLPTYLWSFVQIWGVDVVKVSFNFIDPSLIFMQCCVRSSVFPCLVALHPKCSWMETARWRWQHPLFSTKPSTTSGCNKSPSNRGHYITNPNNASLCIGEIPKFCHRFVLFDSPKMGHICDTVIPFWKLTYPLLKVLLSQWFSFFPRWDALVSWRAMTPG